MSFAADSWRGLRVLIVEDEYFLAQDLADRFQNLGAEVIGPAGNLAEALRLAGRADIDGAVLDVNLRGERVYPVADLLRQKHTPFVFASGYGAELEPDAYSDVPRCIKPVDFATLAQALANQLKIHEAEG
jgi:CheY-like chemotaxis protein